MFIIAADAGYNTLMQSGITPNLAVGDFDSLEAVPDFKNVIKVPKEKDGTDMSLAVKQGMSLGYNLFIIDGGLGGRLDHTLANLQLLKEINLKKSHGILLGKDIGITAITNESVGLTSDNRGVLSVFSFGNKAEGVTLEGLKYPLDNYKMTDNYPIGVSNEFTDKQASITVKSGSLIITWTVKPVSIVFNNLDKIII
jgi:thiamine pyrophosphokinase